MILSRVKPAAVGGEIPVNKKTKEKKPPLVEDFLVQRDYLGAITLLEFQRNVGERGEDADLWLAYCAFHLGDYKREYKALTDKPDCRPDVWVYLACTLFFLGLYKEAEEASRKAPKCQLQNRVLFHLAHKFNDEKQLMGFHQELEDVTEDQLSLASIHYMRSHYQEAIDIYKRILLQNRDFLALNVYVALCYYKLDYYDVSQEVLAVYLQSVPDSTIALNLKACNHFRLYNGKAAEVTQLDKRVLSKSFSKLNLVCLNVALLMFLRLQSVTPKCTTLYSFEFAKELIRHNLVRVMSLGNSLGSYQDHLKIAQQFFQLVGGSASECDTIPGRQCMASCFFLLRQFEDVLIYLNSVKSYFYNDDAFNFNYAQAKAAVGNYREAEEIFLLIQNDKNKSDYVYLSWLARCYIMNQKARLAWELYMKMETSAESFSLLQLIANDCYKMGQFYYSAKAFDILERLDPNPEYWEGKRGACVGIFQLILASREPREALREVLPLLRNTGNPQVEYIIRILKKWAKDNRVSL
uniref:Intraflagellar transport protein 56 n=1 Tax=Oncorhynchus tshawytscha TaxID=74940 RepID=A0A8C8F4F6_ONCTS